ncbi:MAG: PKD domain-containing protein, partial [Fibrobacteria bacterium]|nr:PKD domain-containing protein [Fibrobacteria bacterium]
SYTVVNANMAAAVFGDPEWTDYRLIFEVKETTGDVNRHQVCQFYTRLKDDNDRIEGYQFNLVGNKTISVRSALGQGADIGKINIHQDVDFWGGGQDPLLYRQLTKNTAQTVNPYYENLIVTLEVKGNKITSTYDNQKGGILTMSTTDDSFTKGKVGLGVVYGNYSYNNILVEDIRDNPTGSVPVAIVSDITDSYAINTEVAFSAENSIYSGEQSKLSYLWDFGDGLRGSGQKPKHSFAAKGTYRVSCTISDGEQSTTDAVLVTITAPDDATPPSDVTGLTATATADGIGLKWNAATDNESGISGYIIYRGTSADPVMPLVTIRDIAEFTDVSVLAGTSYHYRVKAINGVKTVSNNFSNSSSIGAIVSDKAIEIRLPKAKLWVSSVGPGSGQDIYFYSPCTQHAEIQLFSSAGKLLATLHNGTVKQGTNNWKWLPSEAHSCLFFVRVKTNNGYLQAKTISIN